MAASGHVAACRAVGPGGKALRLASVYLPSGSMAADLGDFHRLPNWDGPWVVAGDINVDRGGPRNEREVE
eukprot:2346777-Alexandrium_andersonii.AAC.1